MKRLLPTLAETLSARAPVSLSVTRARRWKLQLGRPNKPLFTTFLLATSFAPPHLAVVRSVKTSSEVVSTQQVLLAAETANAVSAHGEP